jgi:hypothetical protein
VPEYDILHLGKDDPTHSETHRYPFAGEEYGEGGKMGCLHSRLCLVLVVLKDCDTETAFCALYCARAPCYPRVA